MLQGSVGVTWVLKAANNCCPQVDPEILTQKPDPSTWLENAHFVEVPMERGRGTHEPRAQCTAAQGLRKTRGQKRGQ